MGPEVNFLGEDAELAPDMIPMMVDCAYGHPHKFSHLLGGFFISDHIGYLDLCRGEVLEF